MYCIYREAFEASLRISKGNRCVVPSGVALWGRRCQVPGEVHPAIHIPSCTHQTKLPAAVLIAFHTYSYSYSCSHSHSHSDSHMYVGKLCSAAATQRAAPNRHSNDSY